MLKDTQRLDYLDGIRALAAVYKGIEMFARGASPMVQFVLLAIAGGGLSLALAWGIGRVFEQRVTRMLTGQGSRLPAPVVQAG